MKAYYKVMLGPKSMHAEVCLKEGFIGVDYDMPFDFTGKLNDNWRDFNSEFIPVYMKRRPDKTKVAAGLAGGTMWVIGKGINVGDYVLSPNGSGSYMVGEVLDGYSYHKDHILPHRRSVKWFDKTIERASMSDTLRASIGATGTYCDVTKYAGEIEALLNGGPKPTVIISTDSTIEDPTVFALEKHLEDFLVQNWKQTELGKTYEIYEENGELAGQQYPSDTGPIDILAISKDKKTLLVVELKKGRVSDNVVGQIQRYMGYVKEELAEESQTVKGVIIGLEDDIRIRRALSVTTNIEFYRYEVSFKLFRN